MSTEPPRPPEAPTPIELPTSLGPPKALTDALGDRYRIERGLGEGGMALLYLADDLRHGRQVAIKVLRPELTEALGRERFLLEIETTARLRHPHILPLYDSGEAGGFFYYVMPLSEGETLRDRLNREKQLPLDEALTIAREVTEAVGHAHAQGIVHRDIKPENILLENGHAVVVDFGIARAARAAGGEELTQAGVAVGTPHYMSPEQASGERDIDGRSDLYAVGCLLYEMLVGRPPFTGPTTESIVRQHLAVDPQPVNHRRPTVPPGITAAVARALAKNPADRFRSAEQLIQALSDPSPPLPMFPSSTSTVSSARSTPARLALGGLLVGALALAGLTAVLLRPGAGATDSGIDVDRVVVMPFRVSAPAELAYLGPGLMDLLSARLDGVVGPRAVDPGAVATAATRSGAGAASVARSLGAGLVLNGSVVGGGGGSTMVTSAELTHVADGSLRASASASGPPDSVAAIADQLIIQLLSISAGEYTTSIASLLSTSPGALRAYLRGRQAYRDGAYREGIAHLDEALALDSTFTLAAIARADGSINAGGIGPDGGLERAWRHRERLGARDLAYLETRLPQTPRTEAEAIAAYERLLSEQPDRVNAWFLLGEYLFHAAGAVFDARWAEGVRTIYDRALELDPRYFPVVDHLIFLDAWFGTPEQLQASARKVYERPNPGDIPPILRGIAEGGAELILDIDSLRAYEANAISFGPWWPILFPDHVPADFVPYVDAFFGEMRRRAGVDIALERALAHEYRVNLAIGRPLRAAAVREALIREGVLDRHHRTAIYDALWDGVAVEDAAGAVRAIDERLAGRRGQDLSPEDGRDLMAAEMWRYRRDRSYAGDAVAAPLRAASMQAAHPADLELEAAALLVEGWARIRRGDPAARGSLDRLVAIIRDDPGGDIARRQVLLAVSAMHEELGDIHGALETLDRHFFGHGPPHSYFVRTWRERGRLAALVGDTARATREYGRWLTLHASAEAEVMPEVEAVRAEVARLGEEPTVTDDHASARTPSRSVRPPTCCASDARPDRPGRARPTGPRTAAGTRSGPTRR